MDTLLLVIGVIAAIIGVVALNSVEPSEKGVGQLAFVGCLTVAAICLGLAFSFRLGANEVGIPITFGKIGSVKGPGGIHAKAPWTDVQKLTVLPFTADPVDYTLRNKDGGEFAARFVTRWRTNKDSATTLYRQQRSSDEQDITNKIVNPLMSGVASDTAKMLRNENVTDDKGQVVEEGIATMSTLTFAQRVQESLAPRLAQKGIVLDDVTIVGDWVLSDAMRDQLANFAAARERTRVATEDGKTAAQEALAAKARSGAAGNIPALTPQQVQVYCANVWRDEVRRATEKGVIVYTTPCGAPGSGLLVGAGK